MNKPSAAFFGLSALSPIFDRIALDCVEARDQNNTEQFRKLADLVVALERAYPEEMAELRKRDAPTVTATDRNVYYKIAIVSNYNDRLTKTTDLNEFFRTFDWTDVLRLIIERKA